MFERFTHDAREAVVQAQARARAERSASITAHHVLAGVAVGDGEVPELLACHGITVDSLATHGPSGDPEADAAALRAIGIDLDAIRGAVEAAFGEGALDRPTPPRRRWPWTRGGSAGVGHIPFTDGAKRALELSLRECLRLGNREISAAHLVLGTLRADDAGLDRALGAIGADVELLRTELESRLRRSA